MVDALVSAGRWGEEMKILAVDSTTEGQKLLAERIESLDPADLEILDISVNLAGLDSFDRHLPDFAVLLLGPGLSHKAPSIVQQAKQSVPDIQILLIVTPQEYADGAFRLTHNLQLRKVLPDNCPIYDLLQELVTIDGELRAKGRVRAGQIVLVTQAKGGMGSTTLCAALAEVCSVRRKRALLWDLDIETKDLSRALTAREARRRVIEGWVDGSAPLTKRNFLDALVPLSEWVSLLRPPATLAAAFDLMNHPDGAGLVGRMTEFASLTHDAVIIDAGGHLGPGIGVLLRAAQRVLVMVDDSVLGLTAAFEYISLLLAILDTESKIRLVGAGTRTVMGEVVATLRTQGLQACCDAWIAGQLPFDRAAETWPGMGKTLYSAGQKRTRRALEEIAENLGVIGWREDAALEETNGRQQDAALGAAVSGSRAAMRPQPAEA